MPVTFPVLLGPCRRTRFALPKMWRTLWGRPTIAALPLAGPAVTQPISADGAGELSWVCTATARGKQRAATRPTRCGRSQSHCGTA
jgi:hypothetical protein